jgi:uncharacterized RDD family membrane protein YckC
MYCSSCGAAAREGEPFCGSCGSPIIGYSASGMPANAAAEPVARGAFASASIAKAEDPVFCAGFWLRLVAHLIDGIVAGIVLVILGAIAVGILGVGFFRAMAEGMNRPNPVFPAMLMALITILAFIIVIGSWLYYAGMESSDTQGTLGKMAMGLFVTDMKGRRITFGRASGRFFAKIITGMIPFAIGYIMAGFTEKKQALHDMIASCLVLRKV